MYWNALFEKREYVCFDILRARIWDNSAIEWWYSQNVFLFARIGTVSYKILSDVAPPTSTPMPLVHPRMLAATVSLFEQIQNSTSWKITTPLRAIRGHWKSRL